MLTIYHNIIYFADTYIYAYIAEGGPFSTKKKVSNLKTFLYPASCKLVCRMKVACGLWYREIIM